MVGQDSNIAVYILSNRQHGTLYIGVTSELLVRIAQHRERAHEGFTKKCHLDRLVWFETHDNMTSAIQREKSLKRWPRQWKVNLIERDHPDWDDLFRQMTD
jgi:putative endonuclease